MSTRVWGHRSSKVQQLNSFIWKGDEEGAIYCSFYRVLLSQVCYSASPGLQSSSSSSSGSSSSSVSASSSFATSCSSSSSSSSARPLISSRLFGPFPVSLWVETRAAFAVTQPCNYIAIIAECSVRGAYLNHVGHVLHVVGQLAQFVVLALQSGDLLVFGLDIFVQLVSLQNCFIKKNVAGKGQVEIDAKHEHLSVLNSLSHSPGEHWTKPCDALLPLLSSKQEEEFLHKQKIKNKNWLLQNYCKHTKCHLTFDHELIGFVV